MKKLFKLFSLLLACGLLFTLTACVPSADKAEEKMKEAGYVAVDPSDFGVENDKCEKIFFFVEGDNAAEAALKVATGKADFLTVLYFNEKADAKDFYEEMNEEFEKADEEDTEGFVIAISGKCVYYGKEAAAKEFK